MKTCFQSKEEAEKDRKWYVVDAEGKNVGRLASQVAAMLRGKNNPKFCPHNDSGDFVIVVNAAKVVFSGNKVNNKVYYRHSNYVGGLKRKSAGELLKKKPEEVILHAVKGMLPKTTLGRAQLSKLKVYAGSEHRHKAQKPAVYSCLCS